MVYEVVELSGRDFRVSINLFHVGKAFVYVALRQFRISEVHRRVLEDLHELFLRKRAFLLYIKDAE